MPRPADKAPRTFRRFRAASLTSVRIFPAAARQTPAFWASAPAVKFFRPRQAIHPAFRGGRGRPIPPTMTALFHNSSSALRLSIRPVSSYPTWNRLAGCCF